MTDHDDEIEEMRRDAERWRKLCYLLAAAHAVALVAEQALALIDGKIQDARIVSWVRGQRYLDAHRDDLALRDWASPAADYDGMLLERPYRT